MSWRSTRTWASQKVNPVDGEPETLALSEPHAGGEDDKGSVAHRHGCCQGLDVAPAERTTSISARFGKAILTHGDAAMRRSPTAALKIVDTRRYTSSTDAGASLALRDLTHAWTSLRRIAPSGRRPRVG